MSLNEFQTRIARTYRGGAYAFVTELTQPEAIEVAILDTGDYEFGKIMDALGRPECTTREKALELFTEATIEARTEMERAQEMSMSSVRAA